MVKYILNNLPFEGDSIKALAPLLYTTERESDNYVHTHFDEFGWSYYDVEHGLFYDVEHGPFYDAEIKLSYLVTMMAENSGCDIWCTPSGINADKIYDELMAENEEFVELNEIIKRRCNCDGLWIDKSEGYIDHQSIYSSVSEFLHSSCVNNMEDFIFDIIENH